MTISRVRKSLRLNRQMDRDRQYTMSEKIHSCVQNLKVYKPLSHVIFFQSGAIGQLPKEEAKCPFLVTFNTLNVIFFAVALC